MNLRNAPLLFPLSFLVGCASIAPPTGGPRDTLPPVLISSIPVDFSRHISSNKIVFKFDEYIDAKDIRSELVVNPVPKIDPITDGHLQTVTIRLKDTLLPNTTYTLNFYKGIKDVDEGNILRDFTYVFSTGDYIDSGRLAGNVLVALTGRSDSSMVVILHKNLEDSAVIKDRPRYLTRVDTTGRFVFDHIEPGRYAVYALKDEGGSHKYLSKSQLFAFADAPVNVTAATMPLTLYAYAEQPETPSSARNTSGNGNTAQPKPSKKPKEKERLEVKANTTNGAFDILDTFRLSFSTGLKLFDSALIRFTDANFKDIPLPQYRWVRDTTNRNFYLAYTWPLDTKYNLILPKAAMADSAGRRLLKDDTITFRTKKDIDYGEVRIRVFNLDLSRRPVLLFYTSDKLKYSIPFGTKKEIRQLLFEPGDYELRILYDTNGNGKWDPGQFFGKHRQPERVISVLKKFTVKANWDNDRDISLSP
ncbi:MAG TPA: Ig-like domain-containing domain [Puia sp.]|nr:Ig-like domain-containing domain [Puia sp.]